METSDKMLKNLKISIQIPVEIKKVRIGNKANSLYLSTEQIFVNLMLKVAKAG